MHLGLSDLKKMLTSMHASPSTSRNQQGMVANVTDLWGFTREMNKLVHSQGLSGAVKVLYCLRGRVLNCGGKMGKRTPHLSDVPCLDSFARAAGRNTTPSGLNFWWSNCSAARREDLVNASSIVSLKVSSLSDRDSEGPTLQVLQNCLYLYNMVEEA